jgi:hypothetical protein
MTHLPYVAASYALGIGIPAWLGLRVMLRLRAAGHLLAVLDPRRNGPGKAK